MLTAEGRAWSVSTDLLVGDMEVLGYVLEDVVSSMRYKGNACLEKNQCNTRGLVNM